MYVSLGNETVIRSRDIIGIFDIENSSVSRITRDYLAEAGKEKRVVYCTYDLPRSFVVCLDEDLTETVYISRISCATLRKRCAVRRSGK